MSPGNRDGIIAQIHINLNSLVVRQSKQAISASPNFHQGVSTLSIASNVFFEFLSKKCAYSNH